MKEKILFVALDIRNKGKVVYQSFDENDVDNYLNAVSDRKRYVKATKSTMVQINN